MSRVVIFGGTTEGREAAAAHLQAGDDVTVCVASDYARKLLPPGVRCLVRPLDRTEMTAFLRGEDPDLVLDATHPFAVRARENIRWASAHAGVRLIRKTRAGGESAGWADAVQWTPDAQAAAEGLRGTEGNVLLTTGSHTLSTYLSAVPPERIYVRVLPDPAVLKGCEALGLPPGHVIAMQGPFSRALNAALYDAWAIRVLVTKDSGEIGGVTDKVAPALERDIHVILIKRPED